MLRGANVVVIGQQSPKTLRGIAVNLEQFRMVVGSLLRGATQPLPMPTVVYAFDDRKAFEPFAPLTAEGKPASLGGYCHCGAASDVSFIALNLGSYGDASRLVFHEYTHQLVRNAVSGIPVWLNEGLAEYYSTFEITASASAGNIGRPIASHVLLLRQRFIPLPELLSIDHSSALYTEGDRRSIFYAESWAFTHYLMIERPAGVAAINRYPAASATAKNEQEAFTAAFGVSAAQMERELRTYVLRPAFKSTHYVLKDRIDVDEPEAARVLSVPDAEARLDDIQRRIGRVAEATPRIEKAAAAGSEDPQAQLTLALLRLQQNRSADAWPLLRKAAALAPDDFLTQYTFALVILRDDLVDPGATQSPLELARDALMKALAVNRNSAEALAWLAYTDLVLEDRLPEARGAIEKASELAPGRRDYRVRLAEIAVRQGDTAGAKRLLTALVVLSQGAADSADDRTAARARALLDRIEAGERAAASRETAARERTIAPLPPTASRRGVEVPSTETPADEARRRQSDSEVRFQLRKVKPGEQRAYGELIEVACAPGGVQFHLRVGTRVVVAVAKQMERST